MEETTMTLPQLLDVMQRRKLSLILPAVLIFTLGVAAALFLPPVYKSSATILIEEPDVSREFGKPAAPGYAEQRIEQITQRMMSLSRLSEIIQQNDLYSELREKLDIEAIAKKMRKDTSFEPVKAEMMDRRGLTAEKTIAFTLSFVGGDPEQVQHIADILVSLFLEENLMNRVKQADDTTEFLESELARLRADLAAQEAKLADYRLQHINELPELLMSNTANITNIERNLQTMTQQLRGLREREVYYQSQLAGLKPHADKEEEIATKKRLEDLKVELVAMSQRLSDEHPDVRKTRTEIAQLEKKLAIATDRTKSSGPPDNPVYVTLSAQLAGARSEIQSIQRQIEQQTAEATEIRRRIAATPKVEEEYGAMVANRNNIQAKINDLTRKLIDSQVARGLEREQKGDRFTLIEPPRVPKDPFKPNRPAIMLISLVLGIGAGVGMAALREFTDDAVHSAEKLESETKLPVLVGIPVIVTAEDIAAATRRRWVWAGAAAVSAAVAVAVLHFAVMELDVLWGKIVGGTAL
jgi:polysaccharide chain length determinant protein (PEP-CTERM system associated)